MGKLWYVLSERFGENCYKEVKLYTWHLFYRQNKYDSFMIGTLHMSEYQCILDGTNFLHLWNINTICNVIK